MLTRTTLGALSALVFSTILAGAGCGDDLEPPVDWTPPVTPTLGPVQLAELGVEVTDSRPMVYTNKVATYFYGEAAGPHLSGYQGLNVRGFTFVDDWHWTAGDTALGSDHFEAATVYPDHAVRRYQGGLAETITLIDGDSALLVEPEGEGPLVLRPLLNDGRSGDYYDLQVADGALLVARQNHMERSSPQDHPVWLAIKSGAGTAAVAAEVVDAGGVKPSMFSPGTITMDAAAPVVFAVADTSADAVALADAILADPSGYRAARAERMQGLLERSYVVTEDARFNRAMAWTRLSMDALIMDQRGKGIFAGLPWFNNYWGRDTFISLPGALLVTGEFEEARAILTSFAEFQNTDDSAPEYGRVPNFVNLNSVSHNTADGTPWFVIQAAAYVAHSGDMDFASEIWPVVARAAEGALRHLDGDGFLTHGDQETWMDASAGPGQEWSPRGDRAVEIQGLWYQQLLATAEIAEAVGEGAAAADYRERAAALAQAFEDRFYDPEAGLLVDHVDADGNADGQLRPNQLFALRSFELDPVVEREITNAVASALVYEYGVASLAQDDDGFHPYHEAPSYYPKDAAYHNGTIWTWLTGPLVSLMVEQGAVEPAYEQIEYLSRLCLDRGAVGAIAENMDALPLEDASEPRLTGTVMQAWSHAEYLRNVYEDLAGVRYLAADHVVLTPSLPASWGHAQVRARMGAGAVVAMLRREPGELYVRLSGDGAVPAGARVTVVGLGQAVEVPVSAGAVVHVAMTTEQVLVDGARVTADEAEAADPGFWSDFAWQTPMLRDDLPALAGPGWPLFERESVKRTPGAEAALILDIDTAAGDDTGPTGTYVYPLHPAFEAGMLDLTGLAIREDEAGFYFDLRFAKLVQPGWNPHLGFQLTYAAILFDTGEGGQSAVGRNAQYTMPDGAGYEFALHVGAGFMLVDGAGNTVAEYRPAPGDVIDPLGSVETGAIRFRVPKSVLPALPAGTAVTVLAGSQDDHGGGGLGDFRTVSAEAGEWNGGGKSDPDGPNVYDLATGTIGPVE
ncbi:amylo-alpha-1,6-glucosidase [Haliangium sp.]|uniref:amylo-alpha-1,6-glucosidase n=1 Tax=Haliangium sp. TaxID=2663208 RepID=UPI003D12454C